MDSEIDDQAHSEAIDELETQRTIASRHLFWMVLAGICLMILALLGVTTTAIVTVQQRDAIEKTEAFVRCQREANASVVNSLKERSEAADQDRAALKLLSSSGSMAIGIVLDPNKTNDEKRAAIQAWQVDQVKASNDLKDADEKRKEHPLVEPKEC